MYLTRIGTNPRRRAPIPEGPTTEVLVAAETSSLAGRVGGGRS